MRFPAINKGGREFATPRSGPIREKDRSTCGSISCLALQTPLRKSAALAHGEAGFGPADPCGRITLLAQALAATGGHVGSPVLVNTILFKSSIAFMAPQQIFNANIGFKYQRNISMLARKDHNNASGN